MALYRVSIPTTGSVTVEVECDEQEQALDAAYEAIEKLHDLSDVHEWEYTECVAQGNVCSAMLNNVMIELLDRS